MITIYTDGSGVNNKNHKHQGYGGFGVYIQKGEEEFYLSKGYKNTTTNRMEMRAILYALQAINNKSEKIIIFSDSQYVVKSIMEDWIGKWESLGWQTCKNPDLWKRIVYELNLFRENKGIVILKHIKGHQNNLSDPHVLGNNIADALADYRNFKEYIEDINNLNSL